MSPTCRPAPAPAAPRPSLILGARAPPAGGRPSAQPRTVYKVRAWRAVQARVPESERREQSAALPQVSEPLAMAGPQQQQPPYLHLAELTASQFLEIWKHFDADGQWSTQLRSPAVEALGGVGGPAAEGRGGGPDSWRAGVCA